MYGFATVLIRKLYHAGNGQLEQLGTAVAGDDFAEEGVGVGVVDEDGECVADLARVAVEDDDAVAGGAAGELERVAVGCRLSAFGQNLILADS